MILKLDESLYNNYTKLKRQLKNLWNSHGIMFKNSSIETSKDMPGTLIIQGDIFRSTDIIFEEIKEIAENCGYYANAHYMDKSDNIIDVWITPKVDRFSVKQNFFGDQVFYHCSPRYNSRGDEIDLSKSGLRIRSRMTDPDYDIYEGRIYLSRKNSSDIEKIVEMVMCEHHLKYTEICLYAVKVPEGYEIYQDPTVEDAIYVTNNIPAKYIKKLDINDYLSDKFKMTNATRKNDKKSFFEDLDFYNELVMELKDFYDGNIHKIDKIIAYSNYTIQIYYKQQKTPQYVANVLIQD